MRRLFKIALEIISGIILLAVVLPVCITLLLQVGFIQNYIAGEFSKFATEKMGVQISIDNIYIKLFNKVNVKGFYVEDPLLRGDTLLYVRDVEARLGSINFSTGKVTIDYANVDGGVMKLKSDSTVLNIKLITDKLKPKKENLNPKPFEMDINSIKIDSFDFAYIRGGDLKPADKINYNDMRFNAINIIAENFTLCNDSINMKVKNLSLTEKSGLNLRKITTDSLKLSSTAISVKDAAIVLDDSWLDLHDFSLNYNGWNMGDFINKVAIRATIKDSYIDMSTIEKFTPSKRGWRSSVKFMGDCNGVISNLSGNITLAQTYGTAIRGAKFNLNGLPDIQQTLFTIDLMSLNTNAADIYHIVDDFTGKVPKKNSILTNAGQINLNGIFNGSFTKFSSKGNIRTLAGTIGFKVSNVKVREAVKIVGSVNTEKLNTGILLGTKNLGNMDFSGNIDSYFSKDSVNIDINSKITNFHYLNYPYSDITVNGTLINKQFKGYIGVDDTNMELDFNGLIELDNAIPKYDFNLDIKHANLFAININKRDSISTISGNITADGEGTTLDNLNGIIVLQDLQYKNHLDTVNVDKITIVTKNSENNKSLRLTSHFADIDLTAKQSYNNIIPYLTETINTYLPAIRDNQIDITNFKIKAPEKKKKEKQQEEEKKIEQAQNSFYVATINVKEANNVASIFYPGLKLAKNSKVAFIFNPALNQFSFSLNSENIERENYWAHNININSRNVADSIYLFASADQLNLNSVYLPNLQIVGGVKNNNIFVSTRFNNDYDGSNALITARAQFEKNGSSNVPRITAQLLPSSFTISKVKWLMGSRNITIDSTRMSVDRLTLVSGDQRIDVNGVLSQNESDTLSANITKIKLDGFSEFVKSLGYNIEGNMNGSIKLMQRGDHYAIATNLAIEQIKLNEYEIPNIYVKSNPKDATTMEYKVSTPSSNFIHATYNYSTGKYNAAVDIKDANLSPLTPIMSVVGKDCDGNADINIQLDNKNRPLNINGDVKIKNFGTTIEFTGVNYKINGDVKIKDNLYTLNSGTVTDPMGVVAPMEASMNGGDRYARIRYKIGVKPQSLLCLNTTLENNALFYGNVYATGDLEVAGHGNNVTMTIAASAVNNSKFYMPLSDKSTIDEADFITFIKPKTEEQYTQRDLINIKRKERRASNSLFTLNITARVQSDTEVQLVIDPTLGDIIKARGDGELTMHIVPARSIFSIVGGYEITDGSYLFTLPNFKLLNKYFTIKPGSTINWTGNPLSANLNVTAVYKTKTSLAPLLGSLPQYSRRTDVNCNLSLSGQLLKPEITLGITVPDADPETAGLVNTALNTEESVSKQIFWLLFSNSFYADAASSSGTNVTVGMMGTAGAVTGIEFLSNQISNWISNDKFNLGFNYRPRSEMSSDELELNFSAPLLNNRLILEAEGNYDFKNNNTYTTQNVKSLSGNFYVTYILDKTGNLRTKAFSRQINTFDENQGLQESGVGIYYKEDFDKIKDLGKRYKKNRALNKHIREQKDSIKAAKNIKTP